MSTTSETITYTTCGHTERVQVTWHGNAAQRESKIAWTRENLTCTDCTDAARTAKGEASTLVGSTRQRAWAEDIRAAAARQWAGLADRATAEDIEHAERILAITDAKWWIDNRSNPFRRSAAPTQTPAPAATAGKFIRIGR